MNELYEDMQLSELPVDKMVEDCYIEYGDYVNNNRAFPQVLDGLKPSYRRLIQTAFEEPDKLTKTASILGTCFTGDTEILDVNGNKISFYELVKRDLEGEPVYTFSCDNKGNPEVTKVAKVWSNGIKNNLVKITLDSGESFTCTDNHLILTRSHGYVPAGSLHPNDRLMPIELVEEDDVTTGIGKRRWIHCGDTYNPVYWLSAEHKDAKDVSTGNDIVHRHHIDHNHSVISVEILDEYKEVFDLEVESEYHNFPLAVGILCHNCMSKFHPHNTESLNETTIPLLVRSHIFDGQGNFGHKPLTRDDACGPAAPRYTEVKLNKTFRSQLSKIASQVPYTFSFSGAKEFDYIPTPIPFALTFGNLGIGVGIGTNIPPFTMKSLLKAYRADNPDFLELNYGYVTNDKEGLRDLWESGSGGLTVEFPVTDGYSGGNYGYWITGYPNIFYPNLEPISDWVSQGRVFIRDETSVTPKLFISRIKRMRTPTDEDLCNIIHEVSKKYAGFKIVTTWNKVARPIGIRDWVNITYNNYINLLNKHKDSSIESMNNEIIMWNNFKVVSDRLLNRESQDKISSDLGISTDIVSAIGSKSINTLINADPQQKIKGLEKSILSYKNLNPVSMVDEFVFEVG